MSIEHKTPDRSPHGWGRQSRHGVRWASTRGHVFKLNALGLVQWVMSASPYDSGYLKRISVSAVGIYCLNNGGGDSARVIRFHPETGSLLAQWAPLLGTQADPMLLQGSQLYGIACGDNGVWVSHRIIYDPAPNRSSLSLYQFDGTLGYRTWSNDYTVGGTDIAIAGDTVIGAFSPIGGYATYRLYRLNSDGSVVWRSTNYDRPIERMTLGAQVFTAGTSFNRGLTAINYDGSSAWVYNPSASASVSIAAPTGGAWYANIGSANNIHIVNNSGSLVNTVHFPGVTAMAALGEFVAVAATGAIKLFTQAGTLLWTAATSGGPIYDLEFDEAGNLHGCGALVSVSDAS